MCFSQDFLDSLLLLLLLLFILLLLMSIHRSYRTVDVTYLHGAVEEASKCDQNSSAKQPDVKHIKSSFLRSLGNCAYGDTNRDGKNEEPENAEDETAFLTELSSN